MTTIRQPILKQGLLNLVTYIQAYFIINLHADEVFLKDGVE